MKPFYPSWDESLAEELIREFEFPRDRPIRQFSRGTKMKLALASSLAYHPRLILLDEPFSGLDPLMRDEFIQGLLERAADTTVVVSSRDLAEIESFATHIGFLDAGRLQFSEDASVLTGRFREIEITLQANPLLPPNLPASWLRPQASAAVVRFVDSRFERERTVNEIYQFFPNAIDIAIRPMPLRDIFVALASARRKAAA